MGAAARSLNNRERWFAMVISEKRLKCSMPNVVFRSHRTGFNVFQLQPRLTNALIAVRINRADVAATHQQGRSAYDRRYPQFYHYNPTKGLGRSTTAEISMGRVRAIRQRGLRERKGAGEVIEPGPCIWA